MRPGGDPKSLISRLSSWVYGRTLSSDPPVRPLFEACRRALVRLLGDPVCSMWVHGRTLAMPLSHPLPLYAYRYQYFDRLPGRIAAFIGNRYGGFVFLDVGANIGDTVASVLSSAGVPVFAVCFEPTPRYRELLEANWRGDDRVLSLPFACSTKSGRARLGLTESDGTASLSPRDPRLHSSAAEVEVVAIDDVVETHRGIAGCRFLKIDTDGHDLEVIGGALKTIERERPFVLFECDDFGRPDYLETFRGTVLELYRVGYDRLMLYDNLGRLLCTCPSSDLARLDEYLLYKALGGVAYFDILAVPPDSAEEFLRSEVEFYEEALSRRPTTETARPVTASTTASGGPGSLNDRAAVASKPMATPTERRSSRGGRW